MAFTNVIKFSKDSNTLCDGIKAYATEYLKNRTSVTKFYTFSGDEEKKKLINKKFLSEVSRLSRVDFSNANDKVSMKRIASNPNVMYFANEIRDNMIDAILPLLIDNSGINAFTDIKYADLGDTIKFDLNSNNIFYVSRAGERKRHGELQKSYRTTETIVGVNHELTVGTTLYEVLAGESYIADEIIKVVLSIENQMYIDVYNAFRAEVTSMNTYNASTWKTPLRATGTYSETTAIEIAQRVQAYNGGAEPIFIGTSLALKNLIPKTSGGMYTFDSDFVKVGYLRDFNGFSALALNQVANPNANNSTSYYNTLIPNNEIYIVTPTTDKICKLGVFGGTYSETDKDPNANNTLFTTTSKHWDVKVCTNSVCGVLTSITQS